MLLGTLISIVIASSVWFQKTGGDEDYAWIHFRCDRSDYEAAYLENQEVVLALGQILAEAGPERIESVSVVAYASPEGGLEHNLALSCARAAALQPLVAEHLPGFAGKITVVAGGEAWEPFRARIEADTRISEAARDKILAIIDDDRVGPDTKEWRLKNRLGTDPAVGDLYRYILQEHFRYLRCLFITIRYKAEVGTVTAPEPGSTEEPPVTPDTGGEVSSNVPPVTPETDAPEKTDIADVLPKTDTSETPETVTETNPKTENQSSGTQLSEDSVSYKVPLFAASTNLLYDLAITPNIALELPVGKHFSVLLDYTFPWWVTRDNRHAWEMLKLDGGLRFWPGKKDKNDRMDVLTGLFAGLDFGAGYYDIEPSHKGYQGELQTVGVELGYAWRLGEKWRLDAFGALGWMGTHYRYYEGNADDSRLLWQYNGRYIWYGPTKAGISIKYIFTAKRGGRAAK